MGFAFLLSHNFVLAVSSFSSHQNIRKKRVWHRNCTNHHHNLTPLLLPMEQIERKKDEGGPCGLVVVVSIQVSPVGQRSSATKTPFCLSFSVLNDKLVKVYTQKVEDHTHTRTLEWVSRVKKQVSEMGDKSFEERIQEKEDRERTTAANESRKKAEQRKNSRKD